VPGGPGSAAGGPGSAAGGAGSANEGPGSAGEGPGSAGEETLPEAFWAVARRLRTTSREILAPWDVTPSHLRALRMVSRHDGMRLSELSEHLGIAPRSATEVVDALESRGMVKRRPDPGDRRATLVELTEHGTSILDAIGAARGAEAERIFGRLSPADRAHLTRILAKLHD